MTRPDLTGAPLDSGQRQPGCLMGPAPYRVAGIGRLPGTECANPAVDQLAATLAWTALIRDAVGEALDQGGMPVVLGGDHALALGSVSGAADRAAPPLFLLWLDAHSDFRTLPFHDLGEHAPRVRRIRHAVCQPGRRFPRPLPRASRRHHGSRRRDLPRDASGLRADPRDRADDLAGPSRPDR